MIIKFRRRPQNAPHVHILSLSCAFERFIEINHLIYDWPVGVLEMKKRHACCCSLCPVVRNAEARIKFFPPPPRRQSIWFIDQLAMKNSKRAAFFDFLSPSRHRVMKSWPQISFTCVQKGCFGCTPSCESSSEWAPHQAAALESSIVSVSFICQLHVTFCNVNKLESVSSGSIFVLKAHSVCLHTCAARLLSTIDTSRIYTLKSPLRPMLIQGLKGSVRSAAVQTN